MLFHETYHLIPIYKYVYIYICVLVLDHMENGFYTLIHIKSLEYTSDMSVFHQNLNILYL